jgi:hypothetical protein
MIVLALDAEREVSARAEVARPRIKSRARRRRTGGL